jgi:hypothetical protein
MFRIRWPKSVNRKLLDATAKAEEPRLSSLLTAISEVELRLQNEPEFVGESRDADKRILIVGPLYVTYRIDSRNRIVKILRVRIQHTKD